MNHYKDIYVIPHSHFDYGYTHPQRMLLELQKDYLTDAIDLCLKTANNPPGTQFKWTIEASWILTEWLKDASEDQIAKLKQCISEGRIAIAAMAYHTTPLANFGEQVDLFSDLKRIEDLFDYKIQTAINHDINGQPWSMPQLLKQLGVDFYLTGINIHYGAIPFERPTPFRWATTDQDHLTCFLGEHYSLFSQFVNSQQLPHLLERDASDEEIHQSMRVDLDVYEEDLAKRTWDKPFYVLTATNPPLYDNNGPDKFLTQAAEAYNRASKDQRIHIITVDELRQLIQEEFSVEQLPVHRGDWTDFWNFGSGSTPAEMRMHKKNQAMLYATDFLNTITDPKEKTVRNLNEARAKNLLFGEHTWGASEAITDPAIDMTKSQRTHKDHLVWDASALAAYALGTAIETANGDPGDFAISNEDVVVSVYNPTPYRYKGQVDLPLLAGSIEDSTLEALRIKDLLAYEAKEGKPSIEVDIDAFSRQSIRFKDLLDKDTASKRQTFNIKEDEGLLSTPHYELEFDKQSGQIIRLVHLESEREIQGGTFGFASIVREQMAETETNHRSTFFPRDVMLGNLGVSVWNHDWQADRRTFDIVEQVELLVEEQRVIFRRRWNEGIGLKWAQVDLIFPLDRDLIEVDVRMDVASPDTPVSYYLNVPTDIEEDWTGRFDTAGVPVRLDDDQIGTVSKDWVTIDSYYAVDAKAKGLLIASPDARLVMPQGFGFGRVSKTIPRDRNPEVLVWLANNYWDTNFSANFSGLLTYNLAIQPYERFDAQKATALGSAASRPVYATLAREHLQDGDKTWYRFTSEQVALQFIRPMDGGIFLALRNLNLDGSEAASFETLDLALDNAHVVNLLGDVQEEIEVMNNRQIDLTLRAGELIFLQLKIKKI